MSRRWDGLKKRQTVATFVVHDEQVVRQFKAQRLGTNHAYQCFDRARLRYRLISRNADLDPLRQRSVALSCRRREGVE